MKQAITLKIAGKSYSFTIDSKKEELYRLAEREVNTHIATIKKNNFKGWNEQDYINMTALQFAILNVDMKHNRELGGDDLKHITQISGEIDTYLNQLTLEEK